MNNLTPTLDAPFTLAFLRDTGQTRATSVQVRRAVRAVVKQSDRFLLVHSTVNGDYKFPGGGVQPGERHLGALARETREETGYLLSAVNQLLGVTVELDIARPGKVQPFRMVSFYYRCEIHTERGVPAPDRYEHELGFHPLWVTLEEALAKNEQLIRSTAAERIFWLSRETAVLRHFISFYNDPIL